MQRALLCANRTIAFGGLGQIGFDLKPNLPAMAASLVGLHSWLIANGLQLPDMQPQRTTPNSRKHPSN
jgi:hypothetical protein